MDYIPDNFSGKLLDVPVGTALFTFLKYQKLQNAKITCLDYSEDMLESAKKRFENSNIKNITIQQGDVGKLPYRDGEFDIVLSMNGFHVFPNKILAYDETYRVLRKGGTFLACFYIKEESKLTDLLVNLVLSKKGWFTPPFETRESLKEKLLLRYEIENYTIEGSMVYFKCIKQ